MSQLKPKHSGRSRRQANKGTVEAGRQFIGDMDRALVDNKHDRLIIGRNPVLEAIAAGTKLRCLWIAGDEAKSEVSRIIRAAHETGVPVHMVSRAEIERLTNAPGHQGVVAFAAPYEYATVESLLERAAQLNQPPFFVILDHMEDPQNFGSLVRTSEAAGVHGMVIPDRRAVGVTPAVGKASAGAIEHMPIARVTNLTRVIEQLQQAGLWVVGADMSGERTLYEADLRGPIAFVIGAEGRGLSRLVRERCDERVRIPMFGRIQSLNAAVAGALLLYEAVRQRSQAARI